MRRFKIHTTETAPEKSRPVMLMAEKAMGYSSSLLGVMAECPGVVNGFAQLNELFQQSTLDPIQREVVVMTIGWENDCSYCIAFHSFLCRMMQVPGEIVKALRDGTALPDPKLNVLAEFTRAVVVDKGYVSDELWKRFTAAGYTNAHGLEVVLALAAQVLTNYSNHLGEAVLEPALQEFAWKKPNGHLAAAAASA